MGGKCVACLWADVPSWCAVRELVTGTRYHVQWPIDVIEASIDKRIVQAIEATTEQHRGSIAQTLKGAQSK
jgi:hypothetical protein